MVVMFFGAILRPGGHVRELIHNRDKCHSSEMDVYFYAVIDPREYR